MVIERAMGKNHQGERSLRLNIIINIIIIIIIIIGIVVVVVVVVVVALCSIMCDDDVDPGCPNVSQCHHRQSFSGLHSPG